MTVQLDALYCFGLGYVAERLAARVLATGGVITGTARTPSKAQTICELGPNAYGVVFTGHEDIDPAGLDGSHWLISIPPSDNGCPAFQAVSDLKVSSQSITYLSTVGVYGNQNGDWVFEDSSVNPHSDRAKRRVKAEQQWLSRGASIVRLPGIYGPGRSAIERLRAGKARRIIKPGQVFNRVHVDDIVTGLEAILSRLNGGVWHLCDDEPAPPQDVIAYAASLLGLDIPPDIPFDEADLSPMGASFYAECKRVSNVATKLKLGWKPKYPSYREGLQAIINSGSMT